MQLACCSWQFCARPRLMLFLHQPSNQDLAEVLTHASITARRRPVLAFAVPKHFHMHWSERSSRRSVCGVGAVAKRLDFPGSGEMDGFWNRGISACAVCDGASPIFRDKPIAVIGGGDSAMEEAIFLTKYGSKVYIIHRRGELRASRIMQTRALEHNKIQVSAVGTRPLRDGPPV